MIEQNYETRKNWKTGKKSQKFNLHRVHGDCNEETAINILYTAKIINEFVQKM